MSENKLSNSEEQIISQAVQRLNSNVLGLVFGVISVIIIFAATNWLVLKGGDVVGPHLSLLGQIFIGYSVTFLGSLIGAVYAFIVGYLSGWLVGWIYNAIVSLKTER